jgi:low affinity Fe/Cu permease
VLSGEANNTNFIVFGLTRPGLVGLTIAFLTIAISIGSLKDFSKTSVLILKNTTTQVVLIPCLALSSATLIPSYVNRQW